MTTRLLAILLIAVEAGALAATTTITIPAAIAAVALCSLFIPFRVNITLRAGLWLGLLGGVLLLARHAVIPDPEFEVQTGKEIGCYLLAIQALALFAKKREAEHPSTVSSGLGIVVMLCAGIQPVEGWRHSAFRGLAIAFVVVAGTIFVSTRDRQPRRATEVSWRKRAAVAGLLLAVALVSWTTAGIFNDGLDAFWAAVTDAKRVRLATGFSGSGDLDAVSSIRVQESDKVQLRVELVQPKTATSPGYLRGQIFSDFNGYDWGSGGSYMRLEPRSWPPNLRPHRSKGNLFGRNAPTATNWQIIRCQPTDDVYWVFAPLGTTHIIVPCDAAEVDSYDVFTVTGMAEGEAYFALVPLDGNAPPEVTRQRRLNRFPHRSEFEGSGADWYPFTPPTTRLPSGMWSELEELAAPVFEGCTTNAEKIEAVARHFRANYRYQLEHDWGEDVDNPMLYFLRERPPAHCEYFATGAALLLTSVDVPCRYATGYVVVEPERPGQWIVRGRHAHAWVEAFDDERGWVVVEATPDAGVPGTFANVAKLAERSNGFWYEFAANTPWMWAAVLAGGIGASIVSLVVFKKLARRWKAWKRDLALQREPMFAELHGLLDQMDKYVRRFELERARSETLLEFTHRVRQRAVEEPHLAEAARWYPIYASCRYDGDVDEASIAILTQRLHDAQAQKGKKRSV